MRFWLLALLCLLLPARAALAAENYALNDDLIYRINFGSAEDVKVLLAKGADPNSRSRQRESALNIAIERNDGEATAIAIALIAKGADVNLPDITGNVPIINAIRYKQPETVKAMIAKGADYHIKVPGSGMNLVAFAKTNGDLESARYIQELWDKEVADFKNLRSPERFHGLAERYILDSCLYQYWTYFLASQQAPERNDEVNGKINTYKRSFYTLASQLQAYYAAPSILSMRKYSSAAVNQIYVDLDGLISNQNRADNNVGKEGDAEKRCGKIVQDLNPSITPIPLTNGAPTPTSVAVPTQQPRPVDNAPAAPPLPMGDPLSSHR